MNFFLNQEEEDVCETFIALLCRYYKKSIDNGMMPKPDCVKRGIEERAADGSDNVEEWLRSKYVFYSGSVKDDFGKHNGSLVYSD
mmetsp:Transcript_4445/g.6315  ORF Transcript_4445/g.6315 Transcript_4445/m.6315 type:complete len:85 (-) Transcript_4445:457-711(-)